MKTCVFIIGTNGSGKSALAKELITRFGGIREVSKGFTGCNNGLVGFAGRYTLDSNYGGVDSLNSTKALEEIIKKAFETHEVIVCEGSYMDTFGMNLTNAMFIAQRHLVIFLYANNSVLHKRLKHRSGGGLTEKIISKQKRVARAAEKWKQVGVPVLYIDSGICPLSREADFLQNTIEDFSKIKL